MANVTFMGSEVTTNGNLPAVGTLAPDFLLANRELQDLGLENFRGKKKVLNIVPSLDTPVCAASARRFNQAISQRGDTVVLVISADLPFAQDRFCSTEGLDNVIPLSMVRGKGFAKDYGVLITAGPLAGLTARAVVVLDESDHVRYTQLVPEIAQEPDYEAALKVLD